MAESVEELKTASVKDASPYLPPSSRASLAQLRRAVQGCRGCELYKNATQAVFGEGKPGAQIMLIGEQPGDQEDLQGKPFVGPAGKLLDRALDEIGLDRSQMYVTNVVKHFKFLPRGKRRIHSKPTMREVRACHPWLEREIFSCEVGCDCVPGSDGVASDARTAVSANEIARDGDSR
jgi:uracil-DNA glycosylase family protein